MSAPSPWLSLDDDEEIVWSGTPRIHVVLWIALPALTIPIVLSIVWSTIIGAAVGVLAWVAVSYLGYAYVSNIEYVVSTKYVYAKRGIYGRTVAQIGLHNIQDTTLSQGILGTRADYGTVSFSTAGGEGTTLGFYYIDAPASVRSAIDRQITAVQNEVDDKPEPKNPEGIETFLSELRKTRNVAQRIDRRLKDGVNNS